MTYTAEVVSQRVRRHGRWGRPVLTMNEVQAYAKHRNLKLAAGELGICWQTPEFSGADRRPLE